MQTKKTTSLNRKFLVSVLITATSFAVFTAMIFYYAELTRSRGKTEIMINQLLDTVEYSSAIAAYANNKQIAQDVIQGLIRNDIVYKVIIKNNQSINIERSKTSLAANTQSVTRQLVSPFNDKEVVGAISVVPQADYNLEEATHSALLSAINSFLLISITTAIILFVFRRNILQPLTFVSNTLHEISAGEKQRIAPLLKHHNDELGRLVLDINGLLDVLETKFENEYNLRKKIEEIEQQLRNIFDSSSAGLFLLDQEGKVFTYNQTFTEILTGNNLPHPELTGKAFAEEFLDNPLLFANMLQSATSTQLLISNDLALRTKSPVDEERWVHCLLSEIKHQTGQTMFEGVIFDVTSRITAERAIRYQAEYDSLTGALRRNSVEHKLVDLLADPNHFPVALMLLDLDGFKAINDNYGHDAGDEVLVEVTTRFKKSIRGSDIIGRLGGDEFLILLNKCEPENAELIIANKIIQTLQEPIVLKSKQEVYVGVSIGISSNMAQPSNAEIMIKAADEAMYAVKRQGKNGFAINKSQGNIVVELFDPKKNIIR